MVQRCTSIFGHIPWKYIFMAGYLWQNISIKLMLDMHLHIWAYNFEFHVEDKTYFGQGNTTYGWQNTKTYICKYLILKRYSFDQAASCQISIVIIAVTIIIILPRLIMITILTTVMIIIIQTRMIILILTSMIMMITIRLGWSMHEMSLLCKRCS